MKSSAPRGSFSVSMLTNDRSNVPADMLKFSTSTRPYSVEEVALTRNCPGYKNSNSPMRIDVTVSATMSGARVAETLFMAT